MAIGGFLELEVQGKKEEYHGATISLNTGRNALEYILRAKEYQKVYVPIFTCDVIFEPLDRLQLDYEFYEVDKSMNPVFDFGRISSREAFLYTNYFGICQKQVEQVAKKCPNLIVDNSQAFFDPPVKGADTFYSPRKFFGVPDGAYLYTNKMIPSELSKDFSYNRCEHLLGRIDRGPEVSYKKFRENNELLSYQPIKIMSNLTKTLLRGIDYKSSKERRIKNFRTLHSHLGKENLLEIGINEDAAPLVYPFMTEDAPVLRRKLISKKIFVPTYWPGVLERAQEVDLASQLTQKILALPIDQRYGENEMKLILSELKNMN